MLLLSEELRGLNVANSAAGPAGNRHSRVVVVVAVAIFIGFTIAEIELVHLPLAHAEQAHQVSLCLLQLVGEFVAVGRSSVEGVFLLLALNFHFAQIFALLSLLLLQALDFPSLLLCVGPVLGDGVLCLFCVVLCCVVLCCVV